MWAAGLNCCGAMVRSNVTMRRANVRFTYEDYLLLPEDKRYEILEGDLYVVATPNIRHQRIARRLLIVLTQHVEERCPGEVFVAPCDVILSENNITQPDLLFVRKERSGIVGELNLQGAPDVVIEILSAGSRNKDLEIKKKIYAQFGIPEYWVVDPDANNIESDRLHLHLSTEALAT